MTADSNLRHTKMSMISPPRPRILVLLSHLVYTLVFLLLSSLIIVGANGYRYNYRTNSFVQTGIISLDVEPTKVTAKLDGVAAKKERTPVKFSYVLPGSHVVEVSKSGYMSWARTLYVNSNEAVIFPFVILFLENGNIQPATESQITLVQSRAEAAPDDDYDIRGNEIWVKPIQRTYPFSVASNEHQLVSRFAGTVHKAVWLPGKTHLIFQVENEIRVMDRDGGNEVVLVTLQAADPTLFTVTNDGKTLVYKDDESYYQRQIQ